MRNLDFGPDAGGIFILIEIGSNSQTLARDKAATAAVNKKAVALGIEDLGDGGTTFAAERLALRAWL
ncbi:hypothetical protein IPG36_03720 [bacterium]|nr:MAG: hypothetical protein IPG36_03720 [bacterium]